MVLKRKRKMDVGWTVRNLCYRQRRNRKIVKVLVLRQHQVQ